MILKETVFEVSKDDARLAADELVNEIRKIGGTVSENMLSLVHMSFMKGADWMFSQLQDHAALMLKEMDLEEFDQKQN